MAVRHCQGWELHVGRRFQDPAEEVNWLFQFTCSGTCTSGLHKETPRLHGLANSKRNAQLCDCSQRVGRPGNHCFDFQPIAESAVRKDVQVELVLLVLWVITLTKSWERGNNFLNVVLF